MKKALTIAAILLATTTILPSCSSTKGTTSTSKVSNGRLSGTWAVSSINYEGVIENNVQRIFDIAPPSAFQNSTWTLTGSGNGSIALNNGTTQPIYWSLYDGNGTNQFQFKKLNPGEKAIKIDTGYRMDVSTADGNNLVLRMPVETGGTTAYIIFNMMKK